MKIIISILHYNSVNDTIACLDSIKKSYKKGLDLSTVVLDNSSKSEFVVDVKKYNDIGLKVYRSETNRGFTGGHNFIFDKVHDRKFDAFLLLNNDSILDESALQNLVHTIKKEGVGAVVAKIYFTKGREYHYDQYKNSELGRVFWYAGGNIDWDNIMSTHRGVDEVDNGQYDEEIEVSFGTGACLMIKREVIEKIGLFDDRYFLYYEDADLCIRIKRNGFSIRYCPDAVAWHNNASSSGSGSNLHDYYLTRNRLLFGLKYAPSRSKIALLRESVRFLINGREWQKKGVKDFFIGRMGRGSFVKK